MVSHIPDAIAHGAEIRTNCMADELPLAQRPTRFVACATSARCTDGQMVEQVQRARAVIVAGYAIESPRLLLNSTSAAFPEGLANSSGCRREIPDGAGRARGLGPLSTSRSASTKHRPRARCTEEFYETDPRNDFVRGYALQTVAPLPIAMAHLLTEEEGDYGEHCSWRGCRTTTTTRRIGVLGEILPDERNFVSLHPTEKDQLRAPRALRALQPVRQRRADDAGRHQPRAAVLDAAGATETHAVTRYAHLVGTCRMGFTPQRFGRGPLVPQLGRAQPAGVRRQRAADAGLRQPGADHLGAGGAHGRLAAARRSGWRVAPALSYPAWQRASSSNLSGSPSSKAAVGGRTTIATGAGSSG